MTHLLERILLLLILHVHHHDPDEVLLPPREVQLRVLTRLRHPDRENYVVCTQVVRYHLKE